MLDTTVQNLAVLRPDALVLCALTLDACSANKAARLSGHTLAECLSVSSSA